MNHDVLSDVMSAIKNAENKGLKSCTSKYSNLTYEVLKLMQKRGYLKKVSRVDDKFGTIQIELKGAVNECSSIRPRFAVTVSEIPKFVKRFLPGAGMGMIIVSTSKGVMAHDDAIKKGIGGRLIAYVY